MEKKKTDTCKNAECNHNGFHPSAGKQECAEVERRIMLVHEFKQLAGRLLKDSKWGNEYGLETEHEDVCKVIAPDDYCAILALLEGMDDQVNKILGLVT